jgi:hypothetical protein
MCFGGGGTTVNIPDPPPLAPPPPPPAPPRAPLPEQQLVETDVNPQVRENKQKKTRNEMSQGTKELRIPLDPNVNTGGNTGATTGGMNK